MRAFTTVGWVQSLGGELRPQKLHGTAKKQKKAKPQSRTDTRALEQNRPKRGAGAPGAGW